MSQISPGDQVVCHIRDQKIVSIYDTEYDIKRIFDVISLYENGYFILVPSNIFIDESVYLNDFNLKNFGIEKKFAGSYAAFINAYKIASIYRKLDGIKCKKCEEFHQMAESNQADGSFICWNCRTYPFYK